MDQGDEGQASSGGPDDHWESPPTGVDYAALFAAFPTACVVLDPQFLIRDVNAAYLTVTGRRREDLLGRALFDAFPDLDPSTGAEGNVRRILTRALRTARPVVLGAQRYDISATDDPTDSQVRYWTSTVVPILDPTGGVAALLYNVHDVTALTQRVEAAAVVGKPRARDLFRAAVEVTEQARLFDDSVIAERQLGLAVQDAMLPGTIPATLADRVVVRYQPAFHVLHVGGDWYDVSHLGDDRFAVAVGDVVGHGLNAAVAMGQLRSALKALSLADLGPAEALTGLDRFAHHDTDASVSTAVKVIIDLRQHTLTYSSAGHPPGLLLHPDGTTQQLDQAAGPALALPIDTGPRPTGIVEYPPGARLLLYTDGLIEHRREDLDVSLQQLIQRLADTRPLPLAAMADQLIADIPASPDDDVALLIVQL